MKQAQVISRLARPATSIFRWREASRSAAALRRFYRETPEQSAPSRLQTAILEISFPPIKPAAKALNMISTFSFPQH